MFKVTVPAFLIPLCLISCGGAPSEPPIGVRHERDAGDAPFCQREGWFFCHPWCFPEAMRCDGTVDCPDAEDESDCDDATPDGDGPVFGDAPGPTVP